MSSVLLLILIGSLLVLTLCDSHQSGLNGLPNGASLDEASIEKQNLTCQTCNCSNNDGDSFWGSTTTRTRRPGLRPSPIPAISDTCQEVLDVFSECVANFSSCLVMNARPITVCQFCIEEYTQLTRLFKNISSGFDNCDVELLNRDHLLVVQTLAKDANWFWMTARCDNCYSHESDEHPPKLCNDTLKFFDLLQKVNSCINGTNDILEGEFEVKNTTEVCSECREDYLDLNKYYEWLNTKYNNRLCMDLVDDMNITRHLWSSTYNCNTINADGLPVLLSSLGFLILPVIYYCANRFVAIAKDTKLVQQKRMSFVQTSYSTASLQR